MAVWKGIGLARRDRSPNSHSEAPGKDIFIAERKTNKSTSHNYSRIGGREADGRPTAVGGSGVRADGTASSGSTSAQSLLVRRGGQRMPTEAADQRRQEAREYRVPYRYGSGLIKRQYGYIRPIPPRRNPQYSTAAYQCTSAICMSSHRVCRFPLAPARRTGLEDRGAGRSWNLSEAIAKSLSPETG